MTGGASGRPAGHTDLPAFPTLRRPYRAKP